MHQLEAYKSHRSGCPCSAHLPPSMAGAPDPSAAKSPAVNKNLLDLMLKEIEDRKREKGAYPISDDELRDQERH